MAYRIELTQASQRITAATIDNSCTPRDRSLNKYTGVTTNNDWADIVNGDSTPGDTNLVLVINANNTTSSREGYGEIMYNINGTECKTILHLVQAGQAGCSCNSITSFPDVSTIEIPATSPYSYTLSPYAESCNMYIQNNNDWLTVTKNSSNIVFTATGAATAYRSGFVYIQTEQGGSVCKTLFIEQYPDDCTITFKMEEYHPSYLVPDVLFNSCDGSVGGAFVVYNKSTHTTEVQECCSPDDNQEIEHALRYEPYPATPNTGVDDVVYEYEYDGYSYNASPYEGVYIQAPCENPSSVCVRLGGYDSGYPDYDVNHHTWVEITDGSTKEYRSLTIEALIRTWNGSPDTYTQEWVRVTAFHEYILHIVGSGDSAFQVGDQVISFRCGTVQGPNGNIPVDMSCSSGCE